MSLQDVSETQIPRNIKTPFSIEPFTEPPIFTDASDTLCKTILTDVPLFYGEFRFHPPSSIEHTLCSDFQKYHLFPKHF